jgi:hypothetical protein
MAERLKEIISESTIKLRMLGYKQIIEEAYVNGCVKRPTEDKSFPGKEFLEYMEDLWDAGIFYIRPSFDGDKSIYHLTPLGTSVAKDLAVEEKWKGYERLSSGNH